MTFEDYFLARPICHRGLHYESQGIMENSREAVVAAIAAHLPIELDVQNTKDGRAVVFHDAHLSRLTNEKGYVRDKTLKEMEALPLKGGGQTLGLDRMLEVVARRVPVLIEFKDQDGALGEKLGSFIPDIIECIESYQGPIALMSFNPYLVQALRAELPKHWIGLTTDKFTKSTWPKVPFSRRRKLRQRMLIPDLKYDFISHDKDDLERVRDYDGPKLCWTVKSQEIEKKAREIADNITFEGYMPNGI